MSYLDYPFSQTCRSKMKEHYMKKILIECLLQKGFYKSNDGRQLYELSIYELQKHYYTVEQDKEKYNSLTKLLENLSIEELKIIAR